MKLSEYVKIYRIENSYAYYHSLKMKPVYLNETEHRILQDKNLHCELLSGDTFNALKENLILVEDETNLIEFVRRHIPQPYVSLAYFILTEQCNLACKYCFLGNGDVNRKNSALLMNKKIAEAALKYFAYQTQQDSEQFADEKEIIFYGGEPLINFSTLKFVVNKSHEYISVGLISSKLKFSMVTNGLLLDAEKIDFLKKNNVAVSISLDGATEKSNAARVDKFGKNVFNKVVEKIHFAKQRGLSFGLSVTITPTLLDDMKTLIEFLQRAEVDSVCFNILHSVDTFNISEDYHRRATEFIISFYEKTKNFPIYEERFGRKLNTFINGGIYYSDCAATSGSQIVIIPSGKVGICHGCQEFFISDVGSRTDLRNNEIFIEWSKLIPIYQDECLKCEALGFCGGGCPINAKNTAGDIHSIDRAFCTHSKLILKYLIEKLYRIIN